MERLIQKYARLFDIAMIIIILLQLMDAVLITLTRCIHCEAVVSVVLSVINLTLLSNSLRCNRTQQFIEWKVNAKILRYTIGLFIVFHLVVCVIHGLNMIELGSHLMNLLTVEIVLTYRINSIKELEDLADKYVKEKRGGN